ncbi:MAG: hypothetical protein IKC42_04085 [Alistipes sp.]|nr:hypothetical protein [Alistipes sp.]
MMSILGYIGSVLQSESLDSGTSVFHLHDLPVLVKQSAQSQKYCLFIWRPIFGRQFFYTAL